MRGPNESKRRAIFSIMRPRSRSFSDLFILFYQYSTSSEVFFLAPTLILVEMCANRTSAIIRLELMVAKRIAELGGRSPQGPAVVARQRSAGRTTRHQAPKGRWWGPKEDLIVSCRNVKRCFFDWLCLYLFRWHWDRSGRAY